MSSNQVSEISNVAKGSSNALAVRQPNALQTQLLKGEQVEAAEEGAITLRYIWQALLKHKAMIAGIVLLTMLAAIIYTLRATPVYQARAKLQIDQSAQKVIGLNAEMEMDQGGGADQLQLRTQIELLKGRALAERVIDELSLYRPAPAIEALPVGDQEKIVGSESGEALPNPMGLQDDKPNFWKQMLLNLQQLFTPSLTDERAIGREETVNAFQNSVTIVPVRNSRLVDLLVINSNADLAARIANQLAKAAIAMNLERKMESSVYARQYLEDQIAQTRAKLEESERRINDYAKRNEILNLGEKGSATTQTFVDFSAALSKAEQDRIRAESQYNEIRQNPESAPQVFSNVAIQTYKEQRARLEAEYAKNLAIFKPDFPAMLQAKAQIDELQARIDSEVATVLKSIKGQYEAAKQQEVLLRAKVASTKSAVQQVQDRSVDMNLLQRELDTNRQVYNTLLQRLKEVSVTANITTNNLTLVDEAKVPLYPHQPKPLLNLALGMLAGLFLGALAALTREQMDDSIKHADEVETFFGLPLLGWIPLSRPPKGSTQAVALQAHTDPRSGFAEAYRSMRTALQFSTPEGAPRRLMVTSCGKSEGKSTTALALAINFAQLGQQVLLIDADMRKSSLHRSLGLPNERGLSNILSGDLNAESMIQPSAIPNLSVMLAGPTPPDPVELLMGPKFALMLDKAHELGFSQVIIDGPPLLGIADAVVLGNMVQHIIFAVKAGETKKSIIKDALRRLRNAGLAPMGVVLTHAKDEHSPGYGYGYQSYYGYGDAVPAETQKVEPRLVSQHGAQAH